MLLLFYKFDNMMTRALQYMYSAPPIVLDLYFRYTDVKVISSSQKYYSYVINVTCRKSKKSVLYYIY